MSNSEWKEYEKKLENGDILSNSKFLGRVRIGNKKLMKYRDLESGNEYYQYINWNAPMIDDECYSEDPISYYRPERIEKYLKKSKRVPTEKYSKKFKSKNEKFNWR